LQTFGPLLLVLIIAVVVVFFRSDYDSLGDFAVQTIMWAVGLVVAFLIGAFILSFIGGGSGSDDGPNDGGDVYCTNLGCEP
jgi:hypothetical protein